MRILHLAYEDPAQPGSGGGSVRTLEINRRLAERHHITALVANYPGARRRVEHGVEWVPLGPRTGGKLDRLTYFALVGPAIRRFPHDLVVEDFGAPFSVAGAPLWTRKPVVASVQWMFAREMRAKYGLPFDWVERAGLGLYDDFIAVSEWLGDLIRTRRPGARITAIPNGVEPLAFQEEPAAPQHLLFVGRLDIAQKGCDLLLDAYARARVLLGERTPPLLIVGDGPDRDAIVDDIAGRGLHDHVRLVGRVDGAVKYRLMATSYAVLMPSRFETFGMVAAEGLAAGAPVVAFDTGPLREVVGEGGAHLIAPFDLNAYADAIVDVVSRPPTVEQRQASRRWARRYDWDAIADQQERIYQRALSLRAATIGNKLAKGNPSA